MLNVHLLAIGLAEVTLVGFGPVLLVGGFAGHCGERSMTQQVDVLGMHRVKCKRGCKRRVREGWWWRWGEDSLQQ
jgi:hypothetical protein